MTARILPPEDWPQLSGTELETVWPHLDPARARVIVVEDADGHIIGSWAGFPLWHAEGVHVAPAHRGRGAVARLLLLTMRQTAEAAGFTSIVTASIHPEVDRLLEHLDAKSIPGTQYVFPVVKET